MKLESTPRAIPRQVFILDQAFTNCWGWLAKRVIWHKPIANSTWHHINMYSYRVNKKYFVRGVFNKLVVCVNKEAALWKQTRAKRSCSSIVFDNHMRGKGNLKESTVRTIVRASWTGWLLLLYYIFFLCRSFYFSLQNRSIYYLYHLNIIHL